MTKKISMCTTITLLVLALATTASTHSLTPKKSLRPGQTPVKKTTLTRHTRHSLEKLEVTPEPAVSISNDNLRAASE